MVESFAGIPHSYFLVYRHIQDSQMSGLELFIKMNNGFQLLHIFLKSSILDFWLNPESAFEFSKFKLATMYLFLVVLMY